MAPRRRCALVLRVLLGLGLALGWAGTLSAALTFPPLTGRVVDQAGVLDAAAEARLATKLADLESKTGTQLVVATLNSLQGTDIADFGYQLGRHWGIGQKGKNNGALLIVAPTERKVRIEVGYGLEGTLTDAVTRLIIDNAVLPRFRTGDFAGGIERGTDDLIQLLSGDVEDFKRRAAAQSGRPAGSEGLSGFVVVLVVLGVFVLLFLGRSRGRRGRRRSSLWGVPVGGAWSSGASGWSSGGWSSGGSDGGGFSGGGGSFGGGGSSGSW